MIQTSKVARTGPKIRTGTDWYGGTDFLVRIFLVRSVVRIFGPNFFGPVRWYGKSVPKFLVRSGGTENPYQLGPWYGKSVPVRIGPWSGLVRGPNWSEVRIGT